jgi:carboxypeptidase Taq
MNSKPIDELKKRLRNVSHLVSILNLLEWDRDVMMPKKGSDARAASIAHLAGMIHEKFVSIDSDGLLTDLKRKLDLKKLKDSEATIVSETWRTFDRQRKLPEKFVEESAEAVSKAHTVWAEAREKNDFKLFLPWLEKIIRLKRKEADYVGYGSSPYDALIDVFEPGMTAESTARVLNDLKKFLMPFIARIAASTKRMSAKGPTRGIKGHFPIEQQAAFNEMVARKIGFDLEAGRIDATTHPFALGIHPTDVRITTRYNESDPLYSFASVIHEVGHGLYEQGLPAEHFGTPLAEFVSLGIHESQSRMWQNFIAQSRPFWRYFYPKLQKEFPKPFRKIPAEDFYRAMNKVEPSFIRTESDEVTYNLHIILRFEIEKGLIEGTIKAKDLPKVWKSKMKEYFGIKVPTDSLGVLQDVHWSSGLIGYFPTYSLGNLYAAQFFMRMKKDMPNMNRQIAKGEFGPIKSWLRKNIHMHGKTHTAAQLVERVTGEPLTSKYFINYLEAKYGNLYLK